MIDDKYRCASVGWGCLVEMSRVFKGMGIPT